jgi:hypothetical protein
MREAVPGVVESRVAKPVPAREVDDDSVRRRLECGRFAVVQAEEENVGSARQRLRVRHERRQRAVEAEIQRRRRFPRQGVRPERDDLELGVPEDTIERLLPRIAGATYESSSERDVIIMQIRRLSCK